MAAWSAQLVDFAAHQHNWVWATETGLAVRQMLMSEVYQKALKISMSARYENTTGEIMNLMTNDCTRLYEGIKFSLHALWGISYIIIFSGLLVWQLDAVALIGILGIAMMPLWARFLKSIIMKLKKSMLKWTD